MTYKEMAISLQDHAGGRVFAFWKQEVRQFLIDNGKSLLQEYHVDGLRYDQVTVIAESGGWTFAQDLSDADPTCACLCLPDPPTRSTTLVASASPSSICPREIPGL